MATTPEWHSMVTASIGGAENYGEGIWPNPWVEKQEQWARRERAYNLITDISDKIRRIFEPRFITGVETCELMEALITMIGAKQILELGTCTGFGTLHFLRAIVGIPGAKVVTIDARPAWDKEFFHSEQLHPWVEMMEGWTPGVLSKLAGRQFDFVFVDSDHSVEHTQKELEALKPITHPGTMICLHDVPEWQTPSHRVAPPVREYLQSLIQSGEFSGMMLPSPRQLDCQEEWSSDYPIQCSPGLAVLIRK